MSGIGSPTMGRRNHTSSRPSPLLKLGLRCVAEAGIEIRAPLYLSTFPVPVCIPAAVGPSLQDRGICVSRHALYRGHHFLRSLSDCLAIRAASDSGRSERSS